MNTKGLRRGDRIEINKMPYQIILVWKGLKPPEFALLNLNDYSIGYTDKRLKNVIDTYEQCT